MPYRLRMSAELGDWLAELRAAQPDTALRVAAALTLLLDSADLPGPPLVTDLFGGSMTDPDDQLAELQLAYRHLFETLTELRATTAMAGLRDATRVRIRRKGPSEVVPLTPEEVASLTPEEVAAADRRERALAAAVRHWSAAVQEFQHNQEIARASYRAATAARDAQRSIVSAPGLAESDRATAQAALAAASAQADTAATAMARLKARATAIRRGIVHSLSEGTADAPAEPLELPDGLLELHADPLGTDARFLFAVEPAGAITLLAVLDSAAAVRSHRDTAIDLASGFLAQLRDRGWPPPEPGAETDERTLADSATFLQKIFPEDIAAVRGHAAALVSVRRIAGLRRDRGLSAAALARRSGLSLGQITKIELGGLRDATVADAAAYISGLGGRLRLAADLGAGEQAEISG